MPKILSFHNELVKYPLYKKLKDNWDAQDRFVKSTIIITILLIIATPAIVGAYLSLTQSASNANKKIWLGINNGFANVDRPLSWIQEDVENMKNETGDYPAVYVLWANFESNNPNIEVLNYLDSKGITPMISLMPRGRDGTEDRRDGRFILSESSITDIVESGKVKFDSGTPATITKIYISKESSGTENPSQTLAPSWVDGHKIEIFGSKPDGTVDYGNTDSFKFEIITKTETANSWILSVSPIKTTTFTGEFKFNEPVFITPSNYFIKNYGNAQIARGSMDNKFREYAQIAAQFNKPIVLRYAQEMNADYYTWSDARKAGKNGKYDRYRFHDFGNREGDFIASWRHIYDFIKPIAPNMLFFWNPHNTDVDKYNAYFPSDRYVDYVGFDAYSGSSSSSKVIAHNQLSNSSANALSKLRSISDKPIIIGETGINSTHSTGVSGNFPEYRRNWLRDGYTHLANEAKVKGILYFDVNMADSSSTGQVANNWRLSADPEIASTYRNLLLNPRFQAKFKSNNDQTPTDPIGFHDATSCEVSSGWTCDADDFTMGLDVEFYADSAKDSGGTYLGKVTASSVREQAVGGQCGGNVNHGFTFTTPETLKDGRSHKVFAYAKDDSRNSSTLLSSSPRNITCGGTGGQEKITVNLTAIEDTYVSSASKTQSYGRSIYLKADATPVQRTFIKFNTSSYAQRTIDKVILELTVSNAQEADSGLVKGIDFRVVPNTWSENTLNYNTPLVLGEVLSTFNGSKTQGQKVSVDLTNYVKTHMGVVSFAIVNRGGNSIFFNSKEVSANKPILKVTYR